MYKDIVKAVSAMTNIRGRYTASAALLDLEVNRILNARDFASNYGRSEWIANSLAVYSVEVEVAEYKKLVVCLQDEETHDITEQVSSSNMEIACPSEESGLSVSISCGIITIASDVAFKSVRAIYKKSLQEIREALVASQGPLLQAYLRWQLLGDIDAKSAGLAYNSYIGLLSNMDRLEVMN